MAAELFYVPQPVAFTTNGLPAAGAKLYFYEEGGLTPADVFTTSALTTAHSHPVVADSSGRVPPIYLDGAVDYRLIIKDRAGNELSDDDPYVPPMVPFSITGLSFVTPQQFGVVADNTTNDGAAVADTFSYLQANATTGYGYSIGGGKLWVPKSSDPYYLGTTTQDIYSTVKIEGESVGEAGGGATVLRWGNATGLRVQRYNTTGDTGTDGTAAGTRGGDASIISGLFLKGSYVATEGSYHGLYLRARASVRDLTLDSWPGDAIRIDADSAGAFGVPVGNANNFEISRAFAQYCRNGIYARGGDVNVGIITGFSAIACREWGVFDEGFLGSVYIGAHTAANGLAGDGTAAHPASAATYLGNRFYVKVGQEVGASTNAPPATATSNTWWGFWQAGGAASGIVAWVSGLNWRAGGGYCTTSDSAQHVFLGCYSEMDQPPSQFSQNSLIIGGLHGAPVVGGGYIRANQNFVQVNKFWSEGYAKFDWPQTDIGPQSGAAADNLVGLNTTGVSNKLAGTSWAAGVSQADGYLQFNRTVNGTVIQGTTVVIVSIGGAFPATFDANGLTLASGKNLYVNSVQVVSARDTGWTADTGTAKKTATAAYVVGTGLTVGAAYVQAEVTAIITRQALVEAALRDATQEIKALKDALITHGLIGA